ncbi:TIGR02147 family protein [Paludibaculum fermentans]|uniref:TIGR02147 family protein n=1 Tax=Paludibaculum fermentans TaxID=1473598 RepID=UPI003EB6A8B0
MKIVTGSSDTGRPALDFRLFLQQELARRCARNPQYSLRAFANFLGVDHSTLSQLLRGRRTFGKTAIQRLSIRLGIDTETRAQFVTQTTQPQDAASKMTEETARLLADWQHHAILELLHLDAFRPDSRWIARVLGIPVDEVNVAVQRLLRLGLLRMEPSGWVDTTGSAIADEGEFTQAAVDRLAAEVRRLAAPPAPDGRWREFSSTTLAVNRDQLPALRQLLDRFRQDLGHLFENAGLRDDVYRLDISLWPVTTAPAPKSEKEVSHNGTTRHAMADPGQGS